MRQNSAHKFKILWLRRTVQLLTLLVLIAVPIITANPYRWSPSRIVLGHLPPPVVRPISGDTWAFKAGGFQIVHPVAFVEAVVTSKVIYLPLVLALLLPLFITLVFGRVFCSFFCPAGFVFELNQKTHRLLGRIGLARKLPVRDIRVLLLVVCLAIGFLVSAPVVSLFDPPHVIGRELMYLFTHHSLSVTGTGLILGILLYETFLGPRTWCGSVCPSGGGLSVLGARRLLRIEMDKDRCILCRKCNEACPYELKPMNLATGDEFDWAKCDNCGLCRDTCPTGALSY
ncbi:MAG: 4Fe-4S binding protein, partial [Nitrospirae bacterium]